MAFIESGRVGMVARGEGGPRLGLQLHPGEDPSTSFLEDAQVWAGVYRELLDAATQVGAEDRRVEWYRERCDFWYRRCRELWAARLKTTADQPVTVAAD